ncbi:glycosyltransferase [Aeromonas veronii]|uniref:glycosyltransferase n=1 Tax=Aeromonas veronii TaxID=654 RepID=UPI001117833A|nr:glycosyltransferase [Aeromonas veronii]
MNVIIFDFSNSLGGAETFNARFISYLVENGDDIAVVGAEESILFELLDEKGIEIKRYVGPELNGFFVSPEEELALSSFGRKIINDFNGQELYVLASYFDVLHRAMHIFNGDKRVHILTGILHPEAWSIWEPGIGFNASRAFKPKQINETWHYQRQLLLKLDRAHAIWYPNDIYRKYNSEYFSVPLNHHSSATVPVEPVTQKIRYNISAPEEFMKVIWLGRFDFFKNESILSFIDSLNVVLNNKPQLHILFDLIGYGYALYEDEVESYKKLAHERLEIRILGKRNESDIYSLIESEKYHFGVAMGSSAYHLAMIGLPVIAIDSCVKGYRRLVKGVWLDEASDEFDEGSSLYLSLIGEPSPQRNNIHVMLEDVFQYGFLENKSRSCCNYVEQFHDIDVILPKIRGFLLESSFSEKFTYRFKRNLPDEFYYRFGIKRNIRIAIFGTGSGAKKFYGKLHSDLVFSDKEIKVKCFFDNDDSKFGAMFCNAPIEKFTLEATNELDVVIIASDYWPEIKAQMISCGLTRSKILRAY